MEEIQKVYLCGNDEEGVQRLEGFHAEIYPSQQSELNAKGVVASSRVKTKPAVRYAWNHKYYTGRLIARHQFSALIAYAIDHKMEKETSEPINIGMVRLLSTETCQKLLLRSFNGLIVCLEFALLQTPTLAVLDQTSCLSVFQFDQGSKPEDPLVPETIFVLKPANNLYVDNQTLSWCPWLPGCSSTILPSNSCPKLSTPSDPSMLLAFSNGSTVQVIDISLAIELQTYRPSEAHTPSETKKSNEQNQWTLESLLEAFKGYAQMKMCYGTACNHTNSVTALALSRDSCYMASSGLDGNVFFYSLLETRSSHDPFHLTPFYEFKPHGESPLYGLAFLDDTRSGAQSGSTWKYFITGAQYNRELKLWSCADKRCLQTIRFCPENSNNSTTTPSPKPAIIMAVDSTASFLVASDITRRVIYVLELGFQSNSTGDDQMHFVSISEFILTVPCILFALGNLNRKPKCSTELSPSKISKLSLVSTDQISLEIHTIHHCYLMNGTIKYDLPRWSEIESSCITQPQNSTCPPENPSNIDSLTKECDTDHPVMASSADLSEFTLVTSQPDSAFPTPFISQEMDGHNDVPNVEVPPPSSPHEQINVADINDGTNYLNEDTVLSTCDSAIRPSGDPSIPFENHDEPQPLQSSGSVVDMVPHIENLHDLTPNLSYPDDSKTIESDINADHRDVSKLEPEFSYTNEDNVLDKMLLGCHMEDEDSGEHMPSPLSVARCDNSLHSLLDDHQSDLESTDITPKTIEAYSAENVEEAVSDNEGNQSDAKQDCCDLPNGSEPVDFEFSATRASDLDKAWSSFSKTRLYSTSSKSVSSNQVAHDFDTSSKDLNAQLLTKMMAILNNLVGTSKKQNKRIDSLTSQLKKTESQLKKMESIQCDLVHTLHSSMPSSNSNLDSNKNATYCSSTCGSERSGDKPQEKPTQTLLQLRSMQGDFSRRFTQLDQSVARLATKISQNNHQPQQPKQGSFTATDPKLNNIPKLTADLVRPAIRGELQNLFISNLPRIIEPLQTALLHTIGDQISPLPVVVSENITRFIKDKNFTTVLSRTLSAELANSYRESMQRVFIPALEKTIQKLFTELNTIFQTGTQQYLNQINSASVASLDSNEIANDVVRLLMSNSKVVQSAVISDVGLLDPVGSVELNDRVLPVRNPKEIASHDNSYHSDVQQTSKETGLQNSGNITDSTKKKSKQPTATATPSKGKSRNKAAKNVNTPAKTPEPDKESAASQPGTDKQDLARLIAQAHSLISSGRLVEALELALVSTNQPFLLDVCNDIDCDTLFGSGKYVIGQNILLSLIHQLSCGHLSSQLELKEKYLQEAITSLDKTDPTTIEHGPRILKLLINRLETLSASDTFRTNNDLRYRVNRLCRMAKRVFQSDKS